MLKINNVFYLLVLVTFNFSLYSNEEPSNKKPCRNLLSSKRYKGELISISSNVERAKRLKQVADGGNIASLYRLGRLYETGKVELFISPYGAEEITCIKNYEAAVYWYEKAAKLGSKEAKFKLGVIYKKGWKDDLESTFSSDEKALKWFIEAAEDGHQEALWHLIEIAEGGNACAQFNLGRICYKNSDVFHINHEKIAIKWLRKARDQGHVEAQAKLNSIENL